MTYISPKPVSLQALRTWLNNAAASINGGAVFVQRSLSSSGACLQFVWLNCNNSKDCEGVVLQISQSLQRMMLQKGRDHEYEYEK